MSDTTHPLSGVNEGVRSTSLLDDDVGRRDTDNYFGEKHTLNTSWIRGKKKTITASGKVMG